MQVVVVDSSSFLTLPHLAPKYQTLPRGTIISLTLISYGSFFSFLSFLKQREKEKEKSGVGGARERERQSSHLLIDSSNTYNGWG